MNGPPENEEAVADARNTRTAEAEPLCAAIILDEADEERKFLRLQIRAARAGHALLKVATGYMLVRNCASSHSTSLDALSHVLSAREGDE